MFTHTFKPYADNSDLCVAELPCGDTCNGDRAMHAARTTPESLAVVLDDGTLLCACGNTPDQSGFDPCLPDGTVDYTLLDNTSGRRVRYICNQCNSISEIDETKHTRDKIALEVYLEMNRTYEQLGSDATEADYAADIIRRLSHLYETGETK